MTDMQKEIDEEYKDAARVLEHVKPLMEMEGWKILATALENQRNFREKQLLNVEALDSVGGVLKMEGLKGEVRGLRLALLLAPSLVEMAEDALKELEDANGDETQSSS